MGIRAKVLRDCRLAAFSIGHSSQQTHLNIYILYYKDYGISPTAGGGGLGRLRSSPPSPSPSPQVQRGEAELDLGTWTWTRGT